jgi:putative tryptophan/tyrosine transport system substrate-binding protein
MKSAMAKERAEAFIVLPSPMLFGEHKRIVDLAAENRVPGMYQAREFVDGVTDVLRGGPP